MPDPVSSNDVADDYPASVLFDRLIELDLAPGKYAIFGSGPLAIRGLIDRLGDLDVLVMGAVWDRVRTMGRVVMYGDDETVDLGNGLTFGRSWAYGDFDVDKLIEDSEIIDGLPFVRIDRVIEFKRIAGRPKDLEHLELIRAAHLD